MSDKSASLGSLGVKFDGEQLTISSRREDLPKQTPKSKARQDNQSADTKAQEPAQSTGFSFGEMSDSPSPTEKKQTGPVSLQRKKMEGEVPELPLPDRGATMGMTTSSLSTTSG